MNLPGRCSQINRLCYLCLRHPSHKTLAQQEWVLYHDSVKDLGMAKKDYAAEVKSIGALTSEGDIATYAFYLELEFVTDNFEAKQNLRLFKRRVLPLWEDPMNREGGRLIFWYGQQLSKAVACPVWRNVVTHLLEVCCRSDHCHRPKVVTQGSPQRPD